MRLAFHYRMPSRKQNFMLEAVPAGAKKYGDEIIPHQGFERVLEDVDGLVLFGIGGYHHEIFDAYKAAGKIVIFWDKGYVRGADTGMFRVAVDEFQPLAYMSTQPAPPNRFRKLRLEPKPYRTLDDGIILFDGASNKFCIWKKLGDQREWAIKMLNKIRQHTDRPIVYRPRPSHNAVAKIEGFGFSDGELDKELARTRVVVSYGGNIGFDCALAGVSHFAIGDSIARPISETNWSRIDSPHIPHKWIREQWLNDVCYCQWNEREIANGLAWLHVRDALTRLGRL